jgi:acyl-CoA reductase-like NAD-dependent aldehyde dehydrogenase
MAELRKEAGLPDGVFNVVQGVQRWPESIGKGAEFVMPTAK